MTPHRALLGALLLAAFSLSAQTPVFPTIEVFPTVAIKGVTKVIRIRTTDTWFCNEPVWCGLKSVKIGGVPSPAASFSELSIELEAVIPDLPAGTVADVEVVDDHGNIRRKSAALHIIAPDAPYSADLFERVLIPVIYNGSGQQGSQWQTDVYMMNGNRYDIPFLRGPVSQLEREHVAKVDVQAPNGYVLYPAKGTTDDLSMNVLVRDLSRQSQSLGTELPAVRERDFEDRRILLLNIPSDNRFRLTLRAYALDRLQGSLDTLNYWIYDLQTGAQVAFGIARLLPPPCTGGSSDPFVPCTPDETQPWSVSVDLMSQHPEIVNKGPLRLSISPLRPDIETGRFWAFLTVTNNETQHVTAITPNP